MVKEKTTLSEDGVLERGGSGVRERESKGYQTRFHSTFSPQVCSTQPTRLTLFICAVDFHTSEADLFRHPAELYKSLGSPSTASVTVHLLKDEHSVPYMKR